MTFWGGASSRAHVGSRTGVPCTRDPAGVCTAVGHMWRGCSALITDQGAEGD